MLTFLGERGEPVAIAPLAFGLLVDRTPGVELFRVEHAEEPPEQSPGGKYREIIPLSQQ